VFGAGIDRFVQEQQQNAALEALGKGKKLIGKTAGGVVGGITTAGEQQLNCSANSMAARAGAALLWPAAVIPTCKGCYRSWPC
jgi:hypothetical protein